MRLIGGSANALVEIVLLVDLDRSLVADDRALHAERLHVETVGKTCCQVRKTWKTCGLVPERAAVDFEELVLIAYYAGTVHQKKESACDHDSRWRHFLVQVPIAMPALCQTQVEVDVSACELACRLVCHGN